MNKQQMMARMNDIAKTAGDKVKSMASAGMRMLEERAEKGDKISKFEQERNMGMIRDNFPGGIEGYANTRMKERSENKSMGKKEVLNKKPNVKKTY